LGRKDIRRGQKCALEDRKTWVFFVFETCPYPTPYNTGRPAGKNMIKSNFYLSIISTALVTSVIVTV
jgi:hypothetical protein